jgi:hypothetical protein
MATTPKRSFGCCCCCSTGPGVTDEGQLSDTRKQLIATNHCQPDNESRNNGNETHGSLLHFPSSGFPLTARQDDHETIDLMRLGVSGQNSFWRCRANCIFCKKARAILNSHLSRPQVLTSGENRGVVILGRESLTVMTADVCRRAIHFGRRFYESKRMERQI